MDEHTDRPNRPQPPSEKLLTFGPPSSTEEGKRSSDPADRSSAYFGTGHGEAGKIAQPGLQFGPEEELLSPSAENKRFVRIDQPHKAKLVKASSGLPAILAMETEHRSADRLPDNSSLCLLQPSGSDSERGPRQGVSQDNEPENLTRLAPSHDKPPEGCRGCLVGELASYEEWTAQSAGPLKFRHPMTPCDPSGASDGDQTRAAGELVLAARQLSKSFVRGSTRLEVLRGLELEVYPGEFLAIVGHSGSGKSTLLHLLATLDRPDEGEIHFRGRRIDNITTRGRDRLRNRHFGIVFQMYHLLPELTALENVMLPLMIGHGPLALLTRWRSFRRQAWQWLEAVGLSHRAHHKPRELSGGEMQRAAIARALVHRPAVLFADEPTGNLDRRTGWEILQLLRGLNRQEKLTIVMVTHDPQVAALADRVLRLFDGRLYPAS